MSSIIFTDLNESFLHVLPTFQLRLSEHGQLALILPLLLPDGQGFWGRWHDDEEL